MAYKEVKEEWAQVADRETEKQRQRQREENQIEEYIPSGVKIIRFTPSEHILVLDCNMRKLVSIDFEHNFWWRDVLRDNGWEIIHIMSWEKDVLRIQLTKRHVIGN